MACSSSIIGVSSIYQATPSYLELSKRPTLSLLPFLEKSHFNCLKASSGANIHFRFRQAVIGGNGNPFVASAVVTPNSVLSEEAFKGLGGFGKDSLDVSDSEYESEEDDVVVGETSVVNKNELSISKLGLPQKLVETLESRGISELFPIQVCLFFAGISRFINFCFLFFAPFGVKFVWSL